MLTKEEGFRLLERLCREQTPVFVLFESASHVRTRLIGTLFRVREDNFLVATTDRPSAANGTLRVSLDKEYEFQFADATDPTNEAAEEQIMQFGNRMLLMQFPEENESLVITFTE